MTSQKISPQKNSSTLWKTLSNYALNGWEEPNLVCRIYKRAHNPIGGHLQFHFRCQVIPFSFKSCECFLRVSVYIPMNKLAFESLVTLQIR